MSTPIRVLVESTPKKVYVSALDWPGLSRGGKTERDAVEALLAAAVRYAKVAGAAGFPLDADDLLIEVVERLDGDAATAFGVPAVIADSDRLAVDAAGAERLASLVEASWAELDGIAAAAPEELRKGPRGGGRDRTKVVQHVVDAEAAYAAVMGRKHRPIDAALLAAMRADMLGILRQPSDGSPIAGRKWPPRYAARRIAWHVLDHAWEIEDRTEPAVD
jgi:hypothetical protein